MASDGQWSRSMYLPHSGGSLIALLSVCQSLLDDNRGFATFKKVEARQVLRRGTSEVAQIPEIRVSERVFGVDLSRWARAVDR